MTKRITKFGSLEPILERNGKLIAEIAVFTSNGRSHTHPTIEICHCIDGEGYVWIEDNPHQAIKHPIKEDQVLTVPPNTGHWMELDEGKTMEMILTYPEESAV